VSSTGVRGGKVLFCGRTRLKALPDAAALAYLASLVDGISAELKYALVAGSVTKRSSRSSPTRRTPRVSAFCKTQRCSESKASALWVCFGAPMPTSVAILCFWLLRSAGQTRLTNSLHDNGSLTSFIKTMKTMPETSSEPRRILVPVDFSAPSRQAFQAALQLAQRFGSRLAVAHVTRRNRPDSHIVAEQVGITFDTRRAGRAKLSEFIEREKLGDLQPARIVADGVPFDEIAKAAKAWEADLLVIATHGYTGLKHVLLGSTTERVVRHAPCPVLVVRSREKRGLKTSFSLDKVRSILVPVDFSKPSLDALPHGLALARRYKAQLCLLHVIAPLHPDMLIDTTQTQRDVRVAAHERLTRLADATRKAWPRTGRELRTGHPVTTITAMAKRTNADLIVMGAHGHSGLKHALLGSVAERVVRQAPCSVLTVREMNL
jgi:nucleotide-binding universal stress UspA family protein